jgi:hypothetical protein
MDLPSERLNLGRAAVLSISRTASLLPVRDADARRLIEEAGIVRLIGGKRCCVWGDVIDCVLVPEQERERRPAAPPMRLKRAKL